MTQEFRGASRINHSPLHESSTHVLLVGELNPYGSDPRYALYNEPANCAGDRLQRLVMGISERRYLAMWRVNLCEERWSLKNAISRAYDLAADDAPWTGVVLLGTRVSLAWSRAIRCDQSLAFERITHREVEVVTTPHPSGRYTAWNKPGTFARAREVFAAAIPDVPWGELDKETP